MTTIEVLRTCKGLVEQRIENTTGIEQTMMTVLLTNIVEAINREESKGEA